MSRVEQAAYEVLRSEGPIQLRHYLWMIVAKVDVGGDRRSAISRGFRMIAGYIFGANGDAHKVAMTAPVIQQRRSSEDPPRWLVRFVMPCRWTMKTLPQPTDRQVSRKAIPDETYAAITFTGFQFVGQAGMGTIVGVQSIVLIGPANVQTLNPSQFVSSATMLAMSGLAIYLSFLLILPVSPAWRRLRIALSVGDSLR